VSGHGAAPTLSRTECRAAARLKSSQVDETTDLSMSWNNRGADGNARTTPPGAIQIRRKEGLDGQADHFREPLISGIIRDIDRCLIRTGRQWLLVVSRKVPDILLDLG
jgi:hypothetical protein